MGEKRTVIRVLKSDVVFHRQLINKAFCFCVQEVSKFQKCQGEYNFGWKFHIHQD